MPFFPFCFFCMITQCFKLFFLKYPGISANRMPGKGVKRRSELSDSSEAAVVMAPAGGRFQSPPRRGRGRLACLTSTTAAPVIPQSPKCDPGPSVERTTAHLYSIAGKNNSGSCAGWTDLATCCSACIHLTCVTVDCLMH